MQLSPLKLRKACVPTFIKFFCRIHDHECDKIAHTKIILQEEIFSSDYPRFFGLFSLKLKEVIAPQTLIGRVIQKQLKKFSIFKDKN